MISVIFVDDDPNLLELFPLLLDSFKVRTAISGEEALKLLEDSSCDVIVTDCRMCGMSGIELMEEVRKTKSIPFIFFTGWRMTEEELKGADYLLKRGDIETFEELKTKLSLLQNKRLSFLNN